jgi:hypothetical protein
MPIYRLPTPGMGPDQSYPINQVQAFAWMMRCGLLRPRWDMHMLHHALIACGRPLPFGVPLQTAPQQPLRAEAPEVARWLKNMLRLE